MCKQIDIFNSYIHHRGQPRNRNLTMLKILTFSFRIQCSNKKTIQAKRNVNELRQHDAQLHWVRYTSTRPVTQIGRHFFCITAREMADCSCPVQHHAVHTSPTICSREDTAVSLLVLLLYISSLMAGAFKRY